MKQIIKLSIIALCVFCMAGCGINHSEYSDDIIPWVYENVFEYYKYEIADKYTEQKDKEFISEYKFIGDSSDDYEYLAFRNCLIEDVYKWEEDRYAIGIESRLSHSHAQSNWTDKYGWIRTTYLEIGLIKNYNYTKEEAKYYNDLFLSDLQTTVKNVQTYWTPFKEFFEEYAISHTEIVDQGFDVNNIGDKYTGYYVVYALTCEDIDRYALVSITEYDDGSKYEYELLAIADSLREINEYLQ